MNLQPRISKTLLQAFLDPKRAMTQHYGAIKGLAALGPRVVSATILILAICCVCKTEVYNICFPSYAFR